jgi:3-deoxy-D-manno-octulosonic-acid transferase
MIMIRLYAGLWLILMPLMRLWLGWRMIKGKEQRDRIAERYGKASVKRPDGKLIWFHAASVGEAVSALALARTIFDKHPDIHILITSGTLTSARMVANARTNHPHAARLIHQMQPLDASYIIRRFLNHWRPDILVSLESDLWPMMICNTHARDIPVMMASAQMSDASMRRWQRIGHAARQIIFSAITRIEAIDEEQADRFRRITNPDWTEINVSGSLKATAPPPAIDDNMVSRINHLANDRTVILLASSHPGEDDIVVEAVEAIQQSEAILLILTPRHIERGKSIHTMLAQRDIPAFLLSQDNWPDSISPAKNMQVCVADVMGQMGSFFSAADIIIMGGGFMPLGGHNPMEPAACGKGVISGTNVNKNTAIYKRLDDFGGVIWADNARDLTQAMLTLITAPTRLQHLNSGAYSAYQSFTRQSHAVADQILQLIASYTSGTSGKARP